MRIYIFWGCLPEGKLGEIIYYSEIIMCLNKPPEHTVTFLTPKKILIKKKVWVKKQTNKKHGNSLILSHLFLIL